MKKILFLIFAFLVIAIVAGFLVLEKSGTDIFALKYGSVQYSDIEIGNMKLNGSESTFSIKGGKVFKDGDELASKKSDEYERILKLAVFFQNLRENPLLFDPYLDLNAFEKAVLKMKDANDALDQKTGWGYANPVSFLEKFLKSSRQYKNFSENVSEENAVEMLAKIREAQIAYVEEAKRLQEVFEVIAGNSGESAMAYLGGESYSSIKLIHQDYGKIIANGEVLRGEIEKMSECLENFKCKRAYLAWENPKLLEIQEGAPLEMLPLEDRDLNNLEIEKGPLEITSSCWGREKENYIFLAKRCYPEQEFCLDWSILAEDAHYVKLGDTPQEEEFKKLGVLRKNQNSTAPYGCNDLTYKPKMRTMAFALDNYASERLFGESSIENLSKEISEKAKIVWEKGKQVEQDFFDATYPSDRALENLGEYYKSAYFFLAAEGVEDSEMKNNFLERIDVISGNFVGSDLILNRSAYHFGNFANDFSLEDLNQKQKEYVFANRNDYSITFLGFSPFVWKSENESEYVFKDSKSGSEISDELRPVIDHQTALRLYGKEKLKEWRMIIRDENF